VGVVVVVIVASEVDVGVDVERVDVVGVADTVDVAVADDLDVVDEVIVASDVDVGVDVVVIDG
jgi:hypothetical protein